LPSDAELSSYFDKDLLGGTTVIAGNAVRDDESAWPEKLYCTRKPERKVVQVKFIPYWKWANRKPGEMRVWIRES